MDITYRPYVDEDLDRCAALAADAWPIAAVISEDTHSLMKGFVKLGLLWSDYTEVCCTNDKVVGFLFGLTQKKLPSFRQSLEMNKMSWQFFTGKYGKPRHRLRFLMSFTQTLVKVEFYCRTFDSAIELFVVDKECRGRGLGQSLMNHFTEHLRQADKKTVYVYTDIECNWTFYEKYGFIKHRDFYDNGLSFLRAARTDSYIYYYNL
ncbi:GNAT family N-acetyltransferase [Planctomycetota bacterium]